MVYVRRDSDGWIQQANEYAATRERLASWSYASSDIIYYVWGGQNVIGEYTTQYGSSALTWRKNYVYAGSRLLSTQTNNGAGGEIQEFHHPDRLGTKLITNGASQYEQSTLPFGTYLGAESTGATNQVFTSYDRSTPANLDYAVNRSYSSGQSRFTQVDPIGMSATSIGNPQSNNLYAYVENKPIDFVDPSGLIMVIVRCEPDRYRVDESGVITIYAGQCSVEVIGGGPIGTSVTPVTPRGPGGIDEGGGGVGDIPYPDILRLQKEFDKRLNSGNCRKKMNELFKALGSKLTIDELANKFFNGKDDKKIVSGIPVSSPYAAAEYGGNTIRIKPHDSDTPNAIRLSADTSNFFHELTHAVRGENGFSHERIAQAIAKVDGSNFKNIQNQVKAEADAKKLKGNKRSEFIDGRYRDMMNKWIRDLCNP